MIDIHLHDQNTYKLYDQKTYKPALFKDLTGALAVVIFQCPFLTLRAIEQFRESFISLRDRKVRLCVFVQKPRHWDERHAGGLPTENSARLKQFEAAIELLRSYGAHVNLRIGIHEKLVTIDQSILWDGSLNILSHFDTSERLHRWVSKQKVEEAIRMHKLDSCDECSRDDYFVAFSRDPESVLERIRLVAKSIVKARNADGISQRELASRLKISRASLCRVESGATSVELGTIVRVCQALGLELMAVPKFVVPCLAQLIQSVEEKES